MATKNYGEWSAKTYLMDFIPHVFIKGTFPTNGEKPIFYLEELKRDGSTMVLELRPGGFDHNGKSNGRVSTAINSHFKTPSKVRVIHGKLTVAEFDITIRFNRGEKEAKKALTVEAFENECWIMIYRDTNYGGDSLKVDGPAEFMNLQSLPNANQDWGDQIGSIRTGSNTWVVLYADDDFGDTNMVVGPNSQIPDLADLEDEVDSMKILNHHP